MATKKKANPEETEYITLQVPKDLPPGVELFYDRREKEWNWRATSQRGIRHLVKLVGKLPE